MPYHCGSHNHWMLQHKAQPPTMHACVAGRFQALCCCHHGASCGGIQSFTHHRISLPRINQCTHTCTLPRPGPLTVPMSPARFWRCSLSPGVCVCVRGGGTQEHSGGVCATHGGWGGSDTGCLGRQHGAGVACIVRQR